MRTNAVRTLGRALLAQGVLLSVVVSIALLGSSAVSAVESVGRTSVNGDPNIYTPPPGSGHDSAGIANNFHMAIRNPNTTPQEIARLVVRHALVACVDPNNVDRCTEFYKNCASHYLTLRGNTNCREERFPTRLDVSVIGLGPIAGMTENISFSDIPTIAEIPNIDFRQPWVRMNTELRGFTAAKTNTALFDSITFKVGRDQGLPSSHGQAEYSPVLLCSPSFTQECSVQGAPCLGPPPGVCTVRRNMYSYFDVDYEMAWVGKAGGPLAGMSATNTGTVRMTLGVPASGQIPTLSGWGMILLIALLVTAATFMIVRKSVRGRPAVG